MSINLFFLKKFHIKSSDQEYINMQPTKLIQVIQVVKETDLGDEDAGATDDYSVVNLIGNSIYRQCELYLNDCQLQDQSSGTFGNKIICIH